MFQVKIMKRKIKGWTVMGMEDFTDKVHCEDEIEVTGQGGREEELNEIG